MPRPRGRRRRHHCRARLSGAALLSHDRLLAAPAQHFYDVITHGYGVMYSYADRVDPHDRWAIAAYIRALQLSRRAKVAEVPGRQGALFHERRQSSTVLGMRCLPAQPLAAALLVGAALLDPKAAAAGWLVGFAFWSQMLVGSLTLMMIHRLTGGRWGMIAPAIVPAAAALPAALPAG